MNNKECFVLGILSGVLLTTLFFTVPNSSQESGINENATSLEYARFYRLDTMRVVNETGLPNQFTCEQIKVMYISDSYPEHKIVSECKDHPEGNYSWCQTRSNPNGLKGDFVRYYILNCLKQKDALVGQDA